ncbi:MAG TPA: arylsulfatase [Planctomycetota bacterium]|nr:arylsulfatase [Planctomycetota bacterium]
MCAVLLCVASLCFFSAAGEGAKPNIIFILADDVGYGDLGCYGATKVKTPNLDKLAADGVRFTSGYAPSATCTPTRYAMLTGQYAWRKKGTGILPGDAAMIIEPGRPTLPAVLKTAGYTTGCVGKWHLGLGNGGAAIDWNGEVKPGPSEIGFDYSFIIPATGDRVPCVYLENQRVVGLDPNDPIKVGYGHKVGDDPTGAKNPELLKMRFTHGHDATIVNGISRIGFMTGGKSARWKDEDMADMITQKAAAFIEKNKDKPFFLYFATHDIHVPRVPHPRFVGTSQCGTRGDVIHQLDWTVGEITAVLERLKLAENTLLIFSSDNGPVLDDGYADGAVKDLNGHTPAGVLRGGKYSLYEGGTRLPFIARWTGRIKPGVSDAIVSQIDFLASFAQLAGYALPADAAPDSFNILPALLGESKVGREYVVEHANGLSLRKGNWKYIPPGPKGAGEQLYNLAEDLSESQNVLKANPSVAAELATLLKQVQEQSRTRP